MLRVKELRLENGLTQKELAKMVKTSQSNIARWEKGIILPSSDFVVMLAKALDVTSDYLLGLDDDFISLNVTHSKAISQEDAELLKKYHSLDYNSKKLLDQMLDRLLPSSVQTNKKKSSS